MFFSREKLEKLFLIQNDTHYLVMSGSVGANVCSISLWESGQKIQIGMDASLWALTKQFDIKIMAQGTALVDCNATTTMDDKGYTLQVGIILWKCISVN